MERPHGGNSKDDTVDIKQEKGTSGGAVPSCGSSSGTVPSWPIRVVLDG